jgi:chromosome segregation ATPase
VSDPLQTRIKQVRLRLNVSHFLALSTWTVTSALVVACIALFVEKLIPVGLSLGVAVFAGVSAGIVLGGILALFTRRNVLDAALELDKAFALKERASTLVGIDDKSRGSPAGQALARDVAARVKDLVVAERVPIRWPRFGWMPLVPLAALIALGTLVGPLDWLNRADARAATPEERARIVEETKALEKKLQEHKQRLEEAGDESLKDLTAKVEAVARDITENKQLTAREAALELGDLAKAIEQRRRELDSVQQMRRSLSRMPSLRDGPAQQLSKALKQGDFTEATKKLQELQKQLQRNKLNAEEKAKLAKQLADLEKQLKDLANLQQRIEQLKKSLPPEQLQKELAKLAQDAERLKQLRDLAEKLGQCAKCLSENSSDANSLKNLDQAMTEAQTILEELMRQDQAAEMVNKLLDDLAQCQAGMCQGDGQQQGRAMGRGRGVGERPEAEDKTGERAVKAKTELSKGPVFLAGQTEGRSFRGESLVEIRQAAAAATRTADEALTRQKVPKQYQKHAREYFDKLNGELNP